MSGKLDKLDFRIIQLLQKDGRASSATLARTLNAPERTVRNRINRMVEQAVISPTVVVNNRHFGYQTAVDIFCEVEINKMEEIAAELLKLPEINYVAYSTGDQDISIQVLLGSSDGIYDVIQHLASIPGVQRTKTVVVPRILKDTYEWIPPEDDFEDYDGDENQIWFSWLDGLGYGTPGTENYFAGNGTGSAVGDENTISYTEETIVNSGFQSMPVSYDNNQQGYAKYSEVELTLAAPRDWTQQDVAEVSLWFRGYPAVTGSFGEAPGGT